MKSQDFIKKYAKRLSDGADFYNVDTSLMSMERYQHSKLKFLLIFPTPHVVKTVSSTFAAINDYIINYCPDVFLDCAYMPEGSDIKLYDQYNLPYAIGNITHLDASHFDVIGFSISVLSEVVTAPVILKSFERCDKPIPTFWSQRKDMSVNDVPIIYGGGITAACSDVMFGSVEDDGEKYTSFMDFLYLGDCGKTDILMNRLIEAKSTGVIHRKQEDHYIPGYVNKEITDLVLEVPGKTVQDYIDSLFDLENIYQPQSYEVKYNDDLRIISNKKINPKAQDHVTPYYPHVLEENLGIGRAVIPANGDNVGTAQTQIAEGCSAAGSCSFEVHPRSRVWTSTGIKKIKDLVGTAPKVQALTSETSQGVAKQTCEQVYRVSLKSGHYLDCSLSHKFLVFNGSSELQEVLGKDLVPGSCIFRKIGSDFEYPYQLIKDNNYLTEEKAELLGFLIGDGYYNDGVVHIYTRESENYYSELFSRVLGVTEQPKLIYDSVKSPGVKVYELKSKIDYESVFGCEPVNSYTACVPDIIFSSPKSVMRAFLKGIFQADGWSNNETIGLTSVSETLIKDVSVLLSYLGYNTSIGRNPYWDSHDDGYKHQSTYWLSIRKLYLDKFRKEIGFVSKQLISDEVSSWSAVSMPKSNALSACVRSIFSSREEARLKGFGSLYEWVRFDRCDNVSVNTLTLFHETYPDVDLPRWYDEVAKGILIPDKVVSVEPLDEVVYMYDVINTETHMCVYDDFLTHQCAEESTLITTSTGLVPIKDIKPGDEVYTGDEWTSVKKVFDNGVKPIVKLSLKTGHTIKCTFDHKFPVLTPNGIVKKPLNEIRRGDYFILPYDFYCSSASSSISNSEAEFVGRMLGRGWWSYKDSQVTACLTCSTADIALTEEFLSSMLPDGITYEKKIQYKHPAMFYIVSESHENSRLYDYLTGLGIDFDLSSKRDIPSSVLSYNREQVCAFLRGLFFACGNVTSGEVTFNTVNEKLSQLVQLRLQELGIFSTIQCVRSSNPRSYTNEEHLLYKLSLSKASGNGLFARLIGFNNPEKDSMIVIKDHIDDNKVIFPIKDQSKLQSLGLHLNVGSPLSAYHLHDVPSDFSEVLDLLRTHHRFTTMVSVESIGNGHVYNLEVQCDSHKYLANGVEFGNCSEGNYTGGHVEKTREQILHESLEAKKYSAAWKYKPYSFNCALSGSIIPNGTGFSIIDELAEC